VLTLSLSAKQTLNIESEGVTLRDAQPVVDDKPLEELYFFSREPIRDTPIQLPS
jgi:hypothetical protein